MTNLTQQQLHQFTKFTAYKDNNGKMLTSCISLALASALDFNSDKQDGKWGDEK
jgi:hypothetical protein